MNGQAMVPLLSAQYNRMKKMGFVDTAGFKD